MSTAFAEVARVSYGKVAEYQRRGLVHFDAIIRLDGPEGAAAHVKVVLSGIFGLVVRHDALDENPVREIEGLGRKKRKRERMVNDRTIGQVLGVFHASEDAARWDLVDMVDVLSGLGCRIGELLALNWDGSIDFQRGTVTFHGTVIRVTDRGLRPGSHEVGRGHAHRPATGVGDGDPETAPRRTHVRSGLPVQHGQVTGPGQHPKADSEGRREDAIQGLHPHDFRHYVSGVLDDTGLSARQIADYLGHERISTTQDDYMEPGVVGEAAGPALADRPAIEPPKDEG